ncbi:MAG: ATP-binding cassette domain-containing protein [Acidimicrobiia bacterium]
MALQAKINPDKVPGRSSPLSIHKLSVSKNSSDILKDISFEVLPGEILGIVGANRSGKTTLGSFISGTIDVPKKNISYQHAIFNGEDLENINPQNRYSKGLHYSFENHRLFDHMTVRDNLEVVMMHSSSKERKKRIQDVIELFPKIENLLNKKVKQCNVGQQQIISIARTIMLFPTVLVLDEPTSGLSEEGIKALTQVLDVLITGSVSVLILERRASFIDDIADRRLNLIDKKLIEPIETSSRAVEWKPEVIKPIEKTNEFETPLIDQSNEDDEWRPEL